jgi:hypothetical protein
VITIYEHGELGFWLDLRACGVDDGFYPDKHRSESHVSGRSTRIADAGKTPLLLQKQVHDYHLAQVSCAGEGRYQMGNTPLTILSG